MMRRIFSWNGLSLFHKAWRVGLAVLVITFGIWTLSPLFYDRVVQEEFPASASQARGPAATSSANPVAAEMVVGDVVGQNVQGRATLEAPMATEAPIATEATMATPSPTGPIALSMGSFIDGSLPGHKSKGTATIYQRENGTRIVRLEDFVATNGPDLFVILSPNANPDRDGVGDTYLQLQALKGNQGNQNYDLTAETDLDMYASVVIWCRAFNVVFGYAPLEKAP